MGRKRLSFEEAIEVIQYKGLRLIGAEVVEVLFSQDKTHRCVITKSDKGFLTYSFEVLEPYDEDWLCMTSIDELPACWVPSSCGVKPVFDDIKILMRELKAEPEYRVYFNNQTNS